VLYKGIVRQVGHLLKLHSTSLESAKCLFIKQNIMALVFSRHVVNKFYASLALCFQFYFS